MTSWLRSLAVGMFVIAIMAGAKAEPLWWNGEHALTRFEPETGALRTLTTPQSVGAVVALADGGAWVVLGGRLVRLGPDLGELAEANIEVQAGEALALANSGSDGAIWVAQGEWLRRYDDSGKLANGWRHIAPISALAVAGPTAVWVADSERLQRHDEEGTLLDSTRIERSESPLAILPDRLGGYLWLLTAESAIQYDVLGRLVERTRVGLPPDTVAAAVESRSGGLWLLRRDGLVAFDRDARARGPWPLPADMVTRPFAMALDPHPERMWIGDDRGTLAFNRATVQWLRLTDGDRTTSIAGSLQAVLPTLVPGEPARGAASTLAFHVGASCNGEPCPEAARYLRALSAFATMDGRNVTSYLAHDPDSGVIILRDVELLRAAEAPLRLWVTDPYGNRSAELVRQPGALLDQSIGQRNAGAKVLPTVSITAPPNNASFAAPGSIVINAVAADSDGTITKVEFYRDAVLLGTDTSAPYSYSWTGVAIGTYKLTARAYDNAGGVTTSAIVTVQVKANSPPTVSLTAPAINSAYTAPATINMAASAADSDGTVGKVEFYQGATKLGTDTTAPFAFSWTSVAGGTYSLSAKATDDKGVITTSATVTVKVNKPPTVALSAPANGTTLSSPASVAITATASDSDGSIAKVEFYRDGVLLGSDTTSPYGYSWSNIPVGTYALTAKAIDNLGATAVSAPRTLTVSTNAPPVVALSSPASGASFVEGAPVALAATASDPDGTIASVKFYAQVPAQGNVLLGTDSTNPYAINAPLSAGSNVLTAVATDNKGATTTSAPVTVTVSVNQDPSVVLTSPVHGQAFPALSPPDITLTANATDPDGVIARVQYYYVPSPTVDNPAPDRVLIGAANAPPYRVVWPAVPLTGTGLCDESGCAPDNYEVIAEATDNAGGAAIANAVITVPNTSPWTIQLASPQGVPSVFNAPATMVLTAVTPTRPVAGDPVASVEFLVDGAIVGTVVGAPNGGSGEYVHVWRNVGAGTRTITARLHDASGFAVDSFPVMVSVKDFTQPPSVAVSAPIHEQTYLPTYQGNPSIPITALASDLDGTVAQIGIVVDDVVAFSGSTSPFTATWSQVPEGLHVVSAVATDNRSAKSAARPVFVRVLPNPRLQAVVLTSPAPGAATSPVVLAADVGAPEGGIDKVHFYSGATLLGTATAPPYRLTAALANGAHSVKAVAVMYGNASMTSTPVALTVGGSNAQPTVALTAPTSGQTFPLGSSIALAASAADADGTVAKVEFFAGTVLVATDTSAPFAGTWTPGTAGSYSLTAKATDNQGATRTSAAVTVTVGSNSPPQVSITAPTNGQTFFAGAPIAITANASDAGGSIAKVEFFAGSTLIGTSTAPPYAASWSASSAGSYVLTAKATDNSNATTTSTAVGITVSANALPTVSLSMPRDGQRFTTGSTVNLIAAAQDGEGAIARVEFYAGSTLLATVASAPYAFAWTNVANGTYVMTARVVDSRGAITTSSPVTIVVQALALTVTSPVPNATITADFTMVTGKLVAPDNSGVTINGVVALVNDQGEFAAGSYPLELGPNIVQITATTPSGESISQQLTIISEGDAPFHVLADPESGFAPMRTTLRYSVRGDDPVSIQVLNLGSGTLDTSNAKEGTIGVITFAIPGIYFPKVIFNYASGKTFEQTVPVLVGDGTWLDRSLRGMINDLFAALGAGKNVLAASFLSGPLRARIEPALNLLGTSVPQLVGSIVGYSAMALDETFATYALKRVVNGKSKVFLLDILQDFDGVWRIDSM